MENIVSVDVDEFVRLVEEGRALTRQGAHAAAQEKFARAAQWYVDDLATDDLYDDWVQPHREKLLKLYLGALGELGNFAARVGEWEHAAEYWERAFKKDYGDEVVCLKLMDCLTRLGRRADALQVYAACERALRELGLEPSNELRAAHVLKLVPA